MKIAAELMAYAKNEAPHYEMETLLAIADRINAEHARIVHEKISKAHADGEQNAINQLRSKSEDHRRGYQLGYEKAMQEIEQTYVKLPVDADGEPIHFKDKVIVPWSDKVYEVSGFSYQENVHLGTMTVWINTHEDGEYKALCAVGSCYHYHEPTVEDLLDEFVERWHDTHHDDLPALKAEYAKRLQLRGDGDE